MVNNKTYNNVISTLLDMANSHQQIQTISVGDIWEVDMEKRTKFPLLHINPTSVNTGDATLTYNFQIFIMDMVDEKSDWTKNSNLNEFNKLYKTLSNEQDVFNETLQIVTDFIGMFRHSVQQSLTTVSNINAPVYFTDDQFNIEPFQERFDNLCCGWVFNLGILVHNDFQTCNIPAGSGGTGR
tara:strand:+ start:2336 stop:2884 length:549 start_codon:yes stop_codon:yes gene_type:complete